MADWIMVQSGVVGRGRCRGNLGASRPGGREPDGARLPGVRDQPEAAGPLPGPLLAGGAKGDSRDAQVLADALRTDAHCLRRLDPVDPVVVELREWSRIAEELTRDRTRLANRIREQL